MIAHLGGVPLEEILPSATGAGDANGSPGNDRQQDAAQERTFQAPAEAVFDAWTSEEVIRRWWHADTIGRRPRQGG